MLAEGFYSYCMLFLFLLQLHILIELMKKGVKTVAINDPLSELSEYIEAKVFFSSSV